MTGLDELKRKMLSDPAVREAYDALRPGMEIAVVVMRARRASGMTQAELATVSGVGLAAIRRLERGEADPRISTLRRIARASGVPIRLKIA